MKKDNNRIRKKIDDLEQIQFELLGELEYIFNRLKTTKQQQNLINLLNYINRDQLNLIQLILTKNGEKNE